VELQKWEKGDIKGQIVINRLDGGDIDVRPSPIIRIKKDKK